MFISKVSGHLNNVLDLRTEVLELIESVRTQIDKKSYGSALLLIYQHIDGETTGNEAQEIASLIDQLSMPASDLEERLMRLRPILINKLPDPAQRLLRNLAQEPQPLLLPVSLEKGANLPVSGDITFAIGGSFSAELAIQALMPASIPEAWHLQVAPGQAITRFGVMGQLGAHGSLAGPIPHGSIAFTTALSSRAEANMIYQFDEDTEVIRALMAAGTDRVLPWKLGELEAHLDPVQPNGHCEGLRRTQLNIGGALDLGGEIGIGRLWSHEISAAMGGQVKTVGLTAKAGASFGFEIKRDGQFFLIAEKDAEGLVRLSITKSKASSFNTTLNLGLEVEVSGLDKVALPYVENLFDDPAGLLSKLERWANPGDLAVEKLKEVLQLDSKNWRADLGKLLLGETTADDVASAYGSKLTRKLTGFLNEKIPFWGRDHSDVATDLLDRLVDSLGLSGEVRDLATGKLHPKLAEALDAVLGDLKKGVAKNIKELVDEAESGVESVLKPLEDIGASVAKAKSALNSGGNDLVNPIIELLQRYQAKRNKLIEGLEAAAKFKVGIAFMREAQKTNGQTSVVSFRVLNVNEVTEGLFWAFTTGKIGQMWQDVLDAEADGHIDQLSGRFDSMSRHRKTTGFSIQFMDQSLSIKREIESDVDVSLDATGNVLVASSALLQTQTVKAFGVTRQTSAVGAYQISDATSSVALPAPVGVSLSLEEKNGLRASELEDFLGSLESDDLAVPLLGEGATQRAVSAFRLARDQGGDPRNTRVDVSFPLDRSMLRRLGGKDVTRERVINLACEYLIDLRLARIRPGEILTDYARRKELKEVEALRDLAKGTRKTSARKLGLLSSRGVSSTGRVLIDSIRAIANRAEALADVVEAIQQVIDKSNELFDSEGNPAKLTKRVRKELDDINEEIQDGLESWLKARLPFSGIFTESVPHQTVALLGMLMQLAGDQRTPLVPVITNRFADTETKILVV